MHRAISPPAGDTPTSRLTVDGARPIRRAITRNDSPAASPARISSRSNNDNRNADRGRARHRRDGLPPAATNTRWIIARLIPNSAAIATCRSPAATRARISDRRA